MATEFPLFPENFAFEGNTNIQIDSGSYFTGVPEDQTFLGTEAFATLSHLTQLEVSLPDTCGKGTLGQIDTALLNFFTALNGIKKYGELYVLGTVNKIQNITNLIRQTSDIIGAILKILVQRLRNWVMEKIRFLIQTVIDNILPEVTKFFKDFAIEQIVDQILCAFDKIIEGLSDLIVDFLYAFVQEIVNPVFCAVEGFTNALVNNLASTIDKELGPILDQIDDVLGGVVSVAGSVFQAIDFITGFRTFLCQQPNCPEVKSFKQGPWGGPTKSQVDSFNNFASFNSNSIVDGADDALAQFFGESSDTYAGPLNCNTDPYACGLPNVEIFGGGGAGAVGSAIVNSIGQIVGVDLFYGGDGYTSPPFVTFTDSCNNGNYASAYSVIDEETGKVTKIVIVNPGGGYLNSPNGLDQFDNPIDTGSGITDDGEDDAGGGGAAGGGGGGTGTGGTGGGGGTIQTEIREYVGCLTSFEIIGTGIGYTINDTVTVNPDIPNLQATVRLNSQGQILAIDVSDIPCDLNQIPEITINSNTGSGARIRPILSFTRVNDVEQFDSQSSRNFKSENLIRVIDCVKQ